MPWSSSWVFVATSSPSTLRGGGRLFRTEEMETELTPDTSESLRRVIVSPSKSIEWIGIDVHPATHTPPAGPPKRARRMAVGSSGYFSYPPSSFKTQTIFASNAVTDAMCRNPMFPAGEFAGRSSGGGSKCQPPRVAAP